MLKNSVLGLLLMFTVSAAHGTSMIVGPWISYTVGSRTSDAVWISCQITSSGVVAESSQTQENRKLTVSPDVLAQYIAAAQSEKVETALHMVAANPPVSLLMGVAPSIPSMVLMSDGATLKTRRGPNSAALMEIVRQQCAGLIGE